MNGIPHLPLLRAGKSYRSLTTTTLKDVRTGAPVAVLSQAHPGMIARDLLKMADNQRALARFSTAELIAICRRAAEIFAQGDLPLDPDSDERQSPEDYLRQLSATTGMPIALALLNLEKIRSVLAGIDAVIDGLTRGLDLSVLDAGFGRENGAGRLLSYQRQTDALGAILPNNSPGVHNLWLPAIPLRVPLVLKPGSSEPWTPLRLANAFLAAGCPPEALSLYPSSHAGATEILNKTGRSMFFGDAATVGSWRGSGKVQLHGPGWSKLIYGDDRIDSFAGDLDVLATSVASNGGRSCINASGIWTPRRGRELAQALAERLVKIEARRLDDPEARLAAFADPSMAEAVSAMIDQQLEISGAIDLTAALRPEGRIARVDGCTFLLPTVIFVDDPTHPLAATELLFPFVAVVECPEAQIFEAIGSTLIGTILSDDPSFRARALACESIDRLNLGAIPTSMISWDQPHEGNLFDHLYHQRAFQLAA